MKVTSSLYLSHTIKAKDADLGGVSFADLKEGDFIYENWSLFQITRKTPKRAYVKSVPTDAGRRNAVEHDVPGSSRVHGNHPNHYVEDFGQLFVTLPDKAAFDRLMEAHTQHMEEIDGLRTTLENRCAERAKHIVEAITYSKGLKTKVEVE